MSTAINFLKTFCGEMGINLCSRKIFVSQHFLNTPQVGTGIEHVCCKTVAKGVWGYMLWNSRQKHIFVELAADGAITNSFTRAIDK